MIRLRTTSHTPPGICRAAQLDARSLSSLDADNAVLPHYAIVCAL